MICDDWRAEARLRRRAGEVIARAELRIAAARVREREQRAADEEGAGALLCAVREARRRLAREVAHGGR